jgi:hypothetical protein
MAGNKALRRELDDASALRAKSDYQVRLDELKARYGHTITVLQDGAGEIERFNCFAYALGVWSEPSYRQLVDEWQSSSLIDAEFVSEMIKRADLAQLLDSETQPGSLVFYFAQKQLRHAGIVEDTSAEPTIRSKWGGNEVHRHKLWEVPACHGDCVRLFRAPDPQAILAGLKAELEAS